VLLGGPPPNNTKTFDPIEGKSKGGYMSAETVQTIIGRAIMEPEYRALLFSDPDKALEGYELTAEEAQSLKSMDKEKLDAVAGELEERVSKSGLGVVDVKLFPKVNYDLGRLMRKF
jgi:hypothetical protein